VRAVDVMVEIGVAVELDLADEGYGRMIRAGIEGLAHRCGER
jgi:hypothetical protein